MSCLPIRDGWIYGYFFQSTLLSPSHLNEVATKVDQDPNRILGPFRCNGPLGAVPKPL